MIRFRSVAFGLALLWTLWGCTEMRSGGDGGDGVRNLHGDLLEMVRHFASRIPGRDSEGYDPPGISEADTMARAFEAMRGADAPAASAVVAALDYSVVRYTDTRTERRLLVLVEHQRPDGSWPHGWGMYIVDPEAQRDVVVEVPHPVADMDTEIIGAQLFRALGAADLFIAGANRDADRDGSSDVAHAEGSAFDALHRAALTPASTTIQIHGWDASSHPEIDAEVAVSSGSVPPGPLAVAIANALTNAGIRACLYDGVHCVALGATTNVQGASARAAGAPFVHLELSSTLRAKPRLVARFVDVVAATVAP
jgi:hypothetical protein